MQLSECRHLNGTIKKIKYWRFIESNGLVINIMMMLMQIMKKEEKKILENLLLQSFRLIHDTWIIINRAIEGNRFRDKDLVHDLKIFVSLLTMILGIDHFGFTSYIIKTGNVTGWMHGNDSSYTVWVHFGPMRPWTLSQTNQILFI